jgi:hypothetical protein
MFPSTATLDAFDSAGNGLRVMFFWRVDRYAHRLERVEGGVVVPLLESIEGSDLDRWPPSPPLQQLSLEKLPDGRNVALLVGMAGASHWSLTAERDPSETGLLFDVACRVKEPPEFLGSDYRALVRHEAAADAIVLHRPGGTGSPAIFQVVAVSDVETVPRPEIDVRGLRLTIEGKIPRSETVRWKYRIRIAR